MSPLDSIRKVTDVAIETERREVDRLRDEAKATISMLEEALANEAPECRACCEPLPSQRSIDALARLVGAQVGRAIEFGGVDREYFRAGLCGSECAARLLEAKEEREAARRFLLVPGGATR